MLKLNYRATGMQKLLTIFLWIILKSRLEFGIWNLGINQNEMAFSINNPVLWQPNGFGDQKLYHFRVELDKGPGSY